MMHRCRSEGCGVRAESGDSTRSQSFRDHFCDHSGHRRGGRTAWASADESANGEPVPVSSAASCASPWVASCARPRRTARSMFVYFWRWPDDVIATSCPRCCTVPVTGFIVAGGGLSVARLRRVRCRPRQESVLLQSLEREPDRLVADAGQCEAHIGDAEDGGAASLRTQPRTLSCLVPVERLQRNYLNMLETSPIGLFIGPVARVPDAAVPADNTRQPRPLTPDIKARQGGLSCRRPNRVETRRSRPRLSTRHERVEIIAGEGTSSRCCPPGPRRPRISTRERPPRAGGRPSRGTRPWTRRGTPRRALRDPGSPGRRTRLRRSVGRGRQRR